MESPGQGLKGKEENGFQFNVCFLFRWSGDCVRGFSSYLPKWVELGGHVIGGCCRVTPSDIKLLSDTLRTMKLSA